ncbi:MAG TPA: hypothetical protein VGQ86_03345 [Candidatus Limnocylindria bacterium]|nr:hypothetical protein [Candidatus Limnocylindria bacterium]
MIDWLRCRLLGHDPERVAGTFIVTCRRPRCDARVNLRLVAAERSR